VAARLVQQHPCEALGDRIGSASVRRLDAIAATRGSAGANTTAADRGATGRFVLTPPLAVFMQA